MPPHSPTLVCAYAHTLPPLPPPPPPPHLHLSFHNIPTPLANILIDMAVLPLYFSDGSWLTRACRVANKNPNAQEFHKNSQALRVVQACSTDLKGNQAAPSGSNFARGNLTPSRDCQLLYIVAHQYYSMYA